MLGYTPPGRHPPGQVLNTPPPGQKPSSGRQPPRAWTWTPPWADTPWPWAWTASPTPPVDRILGTRLWKLRLRTVSMVHRMLNFINLFDLLLLFQNHIRCLPHMTLDFGPVIFIQLVHLSHSVVFYVRKVSFERLFIFVNILTIFVVLWSIDQVDFHLEIIIRWAKKNNFLWIYWFILWCSFCFCNLISTWKY